MLHNIKYKFSLGNCFFRTVSSIFTFKNILNDESTSLEEKNKKILLEKNLWSEKLLEIAQISVKSNLDIVSELNDTQKIFIINHRSMLDIPIIQKALFDSKYKNISLNWVAKKELFDNKFVGNFFKFSKTLSIDRNDNKSIMTLLKNIKERKEEDKNHHFAIFPEGTRNKTENLLLPFKDGTSIIAKKNKLEIIPVFIVEETNIIEGNLKNLKPQNVNVYFGDKIEDLSNIESLYTDFANYIKTILSKKL